MAETIKLFVEGLDEKIEPGIEKGSVVLICGTSGTMKSTLAFNILYHNILEENMKGAYFTLEFDKNRLLRQMKNFGMDAMSLENFLVYDLKSLRMQMGMFEEKQVWIDFIKLQIQKAKRDIGCDLLVIDPLDVLEILGKFTEPRTGLFNFFEWLKEMDITTFLTSGMAQDTSPFGKHEEDFLVDGIIHLKMERIGNVDVQRRIRIVKMRNAKHDLGYFTLFIEGNRFKVTRALEEE